MPTFTAKPGFDTRVSEWLRRCQMVVDHYHSIEFPRLPPHTLEIAGGTRYLKIQEVHQGGSIDRPEERRSAWAFIDITTGDILKPKTWKQPAKHPRGNIFDDDYGMSHIGPYGPNYIGCAPYAKLPNSSY